MSWKAEVSKPSRYIGGEVGQVVKPRAGLCGRMALAFPDVYEVAASHLGYQIIYQRINAQPDLAAERVCAPWTDAEAKLRERGLRLTTLESGSELREFEVIGFSLPYELLVTGVLQILDLAGIPLDSAQRGQSDPLVVGGGPTLCNPEPYARFFDAIVIGDGEHAAIELLRLVGRGRAAGLERAAILRQLAGLPGVYVPSLYRETAAGLEPLEQAPARIRRQILPELDPLSGQGAPLVPLAGAVHDRLSVEICRGCTRGCRFCQAGYFYRPLRERDVDAVLDQVEHQLELSGYEELGLLALSAGDYSQLDGLLSGALALTNRRRIGISLPSLRVESLSPNIVQTIRQVHKTGFTIAVEAGTEALRRSLNKPIVEREVLDTISRVFDAGWRQIKLYFMIGLPGETDQDLQAIAELAGRALAHTRGLSPHAGLNIHVSVFVPKPHTPFQWEPMLALEQGLARLERLRRMLDDNRIRLRWQDPRQSQVEAALARGGRSIARAIEAAFRAGARFDAWTECFDYAKWRAAFDQAGIDLDEAAQRERDPAVALPWAHVDCGVKQEFLLRERGRSRSGELTPDCRSGECQGCGVCDDQAGMLLAAAGARTIEPLVDPESDESVAARVRLRWSKTGRARFLGHLELIALIERALRRSDAPLAYSRGHRPKPRLSFGPPLALGAQSLDEYCDVLMIKHPDLEGLFRSLAQALPDGIALLGLAEQPIKSESLFTAIRAFAYEYRFTDEYLESVRAGARPELGPALERFNAAASWIVDEVRDKEIRRLDVRPLIERLDLLDRRTIGFTIAHRPGKAGVKPLSILGSVFGAQKPELLAGELIKRVTVFQEVQGA